MKIKYISFLICGSLLYFSCDSDMDNLSDPYIQEVTPSNPDIQYSSGSADFSTFVSVGNSLTAGYSDNALFKMGQEVSFPNILAGQFALAGGGSFTQPLMNDDLGGLLFNGSQISNTRLFFDLSTESLENVSGTPSTDVTNIYVGPYNNMGIPGAKSYHLLAPGYGNISNFPMAANPYFIRMASAPNATVLGDAMAMNPTFFTLWPGENDVLGYAASGGDGSDPITDITTFTQANIALASTLVSNGAKGLIVNIPNVIDAPYFTTVPYAPLDPTNPAFGPQIPTLNMVFGQLNQVYAYLGAPERSVVFSETAASAVVIKDESLVNLSAQITQVLLANPNFVLFVQSFGLPAAAAPQVAALLGAYYGQTRQANQGDLLVLPSSNVIGTVNPDSVAYLQGLGLPATLAAQFSIEGVTYGLNDKWVLLPSEQDDVTNAITAFNQVIEQAATTYDLAFFDVNTWFHEVVDSGFQAGSAFMTADFVTGGTFSLDGIHPSPRGYAVIANQMIQIINEKYGSNIPTVNPIDYTGLYIE